MKKIIVPLIIVIFLLSGFYIINSRVQKQNSSVISSVTITKYKVSQQIVPIEKQSISYDAIENETALELLQKTETAKIKGSGANAYVTQIGDRIASDGKKEFWAFYVNGKLADVGAGSYKLKNGDTIMWKIETY
jgi:hypothetical protein